MNEYPKPRIVVSKCIGFDQCRWNGQMASSDVVALLRPYVEFLPICPEVEIGLGVPRESVRVVDVEGQSRLWQPATQRDYTDAMTSFADAYLSHLAEIDGFILKSRSPSCGIKDVRIYPNSDKGMASSKGAGLFGQAVLARFGHLPVEDEGRLTNFALREHFLTRVFALAAFRQVKAEGTMRALVRYQAENKLLLMAYNQREMNALGKIVANHAGAPVAQVYADYEARLHLALARAPRHTAAINVLMHALGYFDALSAAEKAFFLARLEDYRAGKLPLSAPNSIARAWIIRFGSNYLASQTFFAPYPEDLAQITDSGKGRDL